MIEDDLTAHPAQLRDAIRRLRSRLPDGLKACDAPDFDEETRWRIRGLIGEGLCPLREMDAACACPGTCGELADGIMKRLDENGFVIMKRDGK